MALVASAKQLWHLHDTAQSRFKHHTITAVEVILQHRESKLVASQVVPRMMICVPLFFLVSLAAGDVQLDESVREKSTIELDGFTTSTEAPDPYECVSDLYHWSQPHRQWCCSHKKRGYPDIPFDCASGYMDWQYGRSDEKKAYCCLEKWHCMLAVRRSTTGNTSGPKAREISAYKKMKDALCEDPRI